MLALANLALLRLRAARLTGNVSAGHCKRVARKHLKAGHLVRHGTVSARHIPRAATLRNTNSCHQHLRAIGNARLRRAALATRWSPMPPRVRQTLCVLSASPERCQTSGERLALTALLQCPFGPRSRRDSCLHQLGACAFLAKWWPATACAATNASEDSTLTQRTQRRAGNAPPGLTTMKTEWSSASYVLQGALVRAMARYTPYATASARMAIFAPRDPRMLAVVALARLGGLDTKQKASIVVVRAMRGGIRGRGRATARLASQGALHTQRGQQNVSSARLASTTPSSSRSRFGASHVLSGVLREASAANGHVLDGYQRHHPRPRPPRPPHLLRHR